MLKMIFFCHRKDGISHEEYQQMVLGSHVPIALRHHPTMLKYVVNMIDHCPTDSPHYDSIAELSFANAKDFENHLYDSDAGKVVVEKDVARFMGGAAAYATTEHVQKELPQAGPLGSKHAVVKMIAPIVRREGMSHDEFVDHWLNRHRPLALKHHPGLIRYVANVVDRSLSPDAPSLDGIGELYFASNESLRTEIFDSPEGERIISEDIARFIGRTNGYLASEYIQKRP